MTKLSGHKYQKQKGTVLAGLASRKPSITQIRSVSTNYIYDGKWKVSESDICTLFRDSSAIKLSYSLMCFIKAVFIKLVVPLILAT